MLYLHLTYNKYLKAAMINRFILTMDQRCDEPTENSHLTAALSLF